MTFSKATIKVESAVIDSIVRALSEAGPEYLYHYVTMKGRRRVVYIPDIALLEETGVGEDKERTLHVTYKNWRGEVEQRKLLPIRMWWGHTEWHPEDQWLLTAFDVDKERVRDFALKDIQF